MNTTIYVSYCNNFVDNLNVKDPNFIFNKINIFDIIKLIDNKNIKKIIIINNVYKEDILYNFELIAYLSKYLSIIKLNKLFNLRPELFYMDLSLLFNKKISINIKKKIINYGQLTRSNFISNILYHIYTQSKQEIYNNKNVIYNILYNIHPKSYHIFMSIFNKHIFFRNICISNKKMYLIISKIYNFVIKKINFYINLYNKLYMNKNKNLIIIFKVKQLLNIMYNYIQLYSNIKK